MNLYAVSKINMKRLLLPYYYFLLWINDFEYENKLINLTDFNVTRRLINEKINTINYKKWKSKK